MSTNTLQSFYTDQSFDAVVQTRQRIVVVSIAFWHVFRRDMTVAARGFIPFIIQSLVMPLSFLIIFGRVLTGVGLTQQLYPAIFFPGVLGITIFMTSLQSISLSLMLDLDGNHEIDDRLLAPLTVSLVAVEKILFSAVRALAAGALTFALAYAVLGPEYQVRADHLVALCGVMVLYALGSAALGLVIGAALPADKIYLLFTLIFSATAYTGCVYYSWSSVASIKVLQIISLFNPLTYAAEGLRYAMVPDVHGQAVATLPFGWALLGLSASLLAFFFLGTRLLHKRVIS